MTKSGRDRPRCARRRPRRRPGHRGLPRLRACAPRLGSRVGRWLGASGRRHGGHRAPRPQDTNRRSCHRSDRGRCRRGRLPRRGRCRRRGASPSAKVASNREISRSSGGAFRRGAADPCGLPSSRAAFGGHQRLLRRLADRSAAMDFCVLAPTGRCEPGLARPAARGHARPLDSDARDLRPDRRRLGARDLDALAGRGAAGGRRAVPHAERDRALGRLGVRR